MAQLQITCRGFDLSESVLLAVEKHLRRLQRLYRQISRCEVTIDLRHRHQQQGRVFHIQIALHLNRGVIVVNREAERDPSHEVFSIALRDSFRAAKRKMEDHVRIQRGFVKHHEEAATISSSVA